MPVQNQLPLSHSNQYSADSACGHCDGVIRHEPWCITQNPSVQYAYQVVSDPSKLEPWRSPHPACLRCRMGRKKDSAQAALVTRPREQAPFGRTLKGRLPVSVPALEVVLTH